MTTAMGMEERCVFVDTSANTSIAMPVTPDTTAADLKRHLCNAHPICFPDIGIIKVNGLMVRRRSQYYHIPDSILIEDVFQGKKGTWFLHVDVTLLGLGLSDEPSLLGKFGENAYSGREVPCSPKAEKWVTSEFKCNREYKPRERKGEESKSSECILENTQSHVSIKQRDKKQINKRSSSKVVSVDGNKEMCMHVYEEAQITSSQEQEQERPFHYDTEKGMNQEEFSTSPPTIETSIGSVSEVASVTDLITRYFPGYDDLKSSDDPSSGTTNDESRSSRSHQCSLQKLAKSETTERRIDGIMHNTSQSALQAPKKIHFPSPSEQRCTLFVGKEGKAEVGKRFVRVTDDIRICGSMKKSPIIICQSKG